LELTGASPHALEIVNGDWNNTYVIDTAESVYTGTLAINSTLIAPRSGIFKLCSSKEGKNQSSTPLMGI
jgi:hypothetical protein